MSINIISTSISLPEQKITTKEIVQKLNSFVSEEVLKMVQSMGIKNRFSVIDNYAKYLVGKKRRYVLTDTSRMAVYAIERCLSQEASRNDIGLYISITNTALRPLPCTGYEVISQINPDLLSRKVNIINMQNQGCSVLIKAIDISHDYLKCHPDKKVLISVSESHTGLTDKLDLKKKILSFQEIKELTNEDEQNQQLLVLNKRINYCLFGDGAVAILIGHNESNLLYCDHITNIKNNDVNVLYMNEGGIQTPCYKGFPHYTLTKKVPKKGIEYSRLLIDCLASRGQIELREFKDIDEFLIHTGSKKIIDGISRDLGIIEKDRLFVSYHILSEFGNLSSWSIGFMLHYVRKENFSNKLFLVSFGVGFSGSISVLQNIGKDIIEK